MDKEFASSHHVTPLFFSDMNALREKADVQINCNSAKRLFHVMEQLENKIKFASMDGNQEQLYICMFRYVSVFKKVLTTSEYKSNTNSKEYLKLKEKVTSCANQSKKYLQGLEKLHEILSLRYKELEAHNKECDKNIHLADSIISDLNHTEREKDPVNPLFINAKTLCEMYNSLSTMKNGKMSTAVSSKQFLVIDVRPKNHYNDSRLILNSISIPAEVIQRGQSAATLGAGLDEDTKGLWHQRDQFDRVILMDWSSRWDGLDPNSKLGIIRDIMINWDPMTKYKRPVLILDGGYEDLILRYPKLSTNPKIDPPLIANNSITTSLKDFEYPMSLLEDELRPPPQPIVPAPADPERSPTPPLSVPNQRPFTPPPAVPTPQPPSSSPRILTVNRANKPKTYSNSGKSKRDSDISKICGEGDLPQNQEDAEEDTMSPTEHPENEPPPLELSPQVISVSSQDSEPTGRVIPEEILSDLRKKKPIPMDVDLTPAPTRSRGAAEDEDITFSPLNEESSSSNLRRSLSTPNVAKMEEDYAPSTKPTYSRANKPQEHKLPFTSHIMGERIDSTYGKTALGLTGLKNFANNCYMNSIIQCLSNTEALVKELVRPLDKPAINSSSPTRGRVANEVIATFRSLWSGDVKCYSLRELKNLMGSYQDIYRGSNHQDSHEFLIILLEYLHNDLNIPAEVCNLTGAEEDTGERAWGEFRQKNCSPVQRLFCGQERSTVQCLQCSHKSVTFGQFFQLAVPIPSGGRPPTLSSCLSLYLAGEKIHGWQCPNCKTSRDAFKKIDITRLPPVLVIALKRFTQEGGSWLEKRESLVTYPLSDLDMREHVAPGSEQRHTFYDLHALSTHTGTLRAGHYRAIARNYINNKWYMFDDASHYEMSPMEVVNIPEVYILFYHSNKYSSP